MIPFGLWIMESWFPLRLQVGEANPRIEKLIFDCDQCPVSLTRFQRIFLDFLLDVMAYFGAVCHPLTENHHVHASVHILNEQLYRKLSYPLQLTYWANSEWNRSWLVKKLVRLVQNGKEPFFTSSPTELLEYWTGSALPALLSSPISH